MMNAPHYDVPLPSRDVSMRGPAAEAGLLPIVVGAHSGAFDLVPYDAPEVSWGTWGGTWMLHMAGLDPEGWRKNQLRTKGSTKRATKKSGFVSSLCSV